MAQPTNLGQFEQIVIAAILALGEDAYGVTIHAQGQRIVPAQKSEPGRGYATLDRLEEKRLGRLLAVGAHLGAGGRSRRHYRLEKSGEKALRDSGAVTARRIYRKPSKKVLVKVYGRPNGQNYPPALMGRAVILIPPASREAVAGDLREMYASPRQYGLAALQSCPLSSPARRGATPICRCWAYREFSCLPVWSVLHCRQLRPAV